jgi:hypothetical protein
MSEHTTPYYMRRKYGWGPKDRTCGECVSFRGDESGDCPEGGFCAHEKAEASQAVCPETKACRLFKSTWRAERELLEAAGQQCIQFFGKQETRLA